MAPSAALARVIAEIEADRVRAARKLAISATHNATSAKPIAIKLTVVIELSFNVRLSAARG